ncbi:superinfection immunity protein [Trinickia mobilis]|uniref:superinfection immunity protein n=1 Tax=Trinickia mobilis TaxID=2816356 RepID=UPI001A8F98E9|nr:superinfection immunity protein [Trinickia mobilis]
MHFFLSCLLFSVVVVVYFTPSMIAQRRLKQEAARLLIFNLLLGWTVMGWLGALCWATKSDGADTRSAENAARWHRRLGDVRCKRKWC